MFFLGKLYYRIAQVNLSVERCRSWSQLTCMLWSRKSVLPTDMSESIELWTHIIANIGLAIQHLARSTMGRKGGGRKAFLKTAKNLEDDTEDISPPTEEYLPETEFKVDALATDPSLKFLRQSPDAQTAETPSVPSDSAKVAQGNVHAGAADTQVSLAEDETRGQLIQRHKRVSRQLAQDIRKGENDCQERMLWTYFLCHRRNSNLQCSQDEIDDSAWSSLSYRRWKRIKNTWRSLGRRERYGEHNNSHRKDVVYSKNC